MDFLQDNKNSIGLYKNNRLFKRLCASSGWDVIGKILKEIKSTTVTA